ncbi:DUF551 domain-containing protein [Klebsiella michiganensis]|uniref:DUF551 domain-containing protein n=1 Tax=Klebsiella michiganensis TaxID=1134687 RepID=UPI002113D024|nr:DUF551 domain-containing protein [Klebsiella michiganensis]
MTNNQLTEEELQTLIIELQQTAYRLNGTNSAYLMSDAIKPLRELQERRKAAMDSEPVAWRWRWSDDAEGYWRYTEEQRETRGSVTAQQLYRHAQQPVVPEEMNFSAACNFVQINGMAKEDRVTLAMRVWNACRAAILQAQSDDDGEPTDDERIMAIEGIHNCDRCGDEGWVVGEMGITRCACGQAGNSPVIPEGWTGNDKANAALMMLDRIETIDSVDDDRIDGIKRIVRELAAATTGIPIISDTWIPVGERMPEDEQEVLTRNRMGHRFVSFFDKHSGLFFDRIDAPAACSIEHVLVTHWMPLPAGPQEPNP